MAGVSTKEIKTRIRSMESTKQITKAMEMVAASKLRHAQARVQDSRPYFEILHATIADIVSTNSDFTSEYLQSRPVKRSVYVVIAGDRGLAGGYNSNILKLAESDFGEKNVTVLPIGKKAVDYFKSHHISLITEQYACAADMQVGDCFSLAKQLCKMYLNGEADEIPLTGSSTNRYEDVAGMILNYFLPYQQDSLVFGKDGKVVFAPFTDEFKMGMEYLIDLYNNGLIDPAAFTNDGSMLNASFTNGEHKTVFATPAMAAWWALTDDISINKKYVVMEPVASDVCPGYQEQSAFVDQASTFSWFITDKCENPEVALKLADAFFTEDFNFLAFTGPEGLAWERIENPYPSCVEGVNVEYKILAPKDEATKETIDKNKLSVNFAFSPSYLRAKQGLLDVSEDIYYSSSGLEARLFLETAKVADYFYPEYVPANLFIEDNDTRAKFNTARTSTIEYVKASITQFITGEMDLDSDWDTFVKTINGYGVDEYISIYQNAYDDYLGVQ